MSADYPDREVWLAKRDTLRGQVHAVRQWPSRRDGTFNVGRNAAKRAKRAKR